MASKKVGEGVIPKGWEKKERYHTLFGEKLPIVVGKTPLSEKFLQRPSAELIPNDKKLTPSILMGKFKNLGLVIDITETNRFYDPLEFTREEIEYFKLEIPGSVKKKDEDEVKMFEHKVGLVLQKLHDFLHNKNSNGKVVFLHSTCGHYRLGYMLCRFLTDRRGYDVGRARNVVFACLSVPAVDGNGLKWLSDRKFCVCKEPEKAEDWWSEVSKGFEAVDGDKETEQPIAKRQRTTSNEEKAYDSQ